MPGTRRQPRFRERNGRDPGTGPGRRRLHRDHHGAACSRARARKLLRRLRRALIARQRVQVFRIATDTRGGEGDVLRTRDNRSLSAETVSSSNEMRERLALGVEVVGIDEAQFFDEGLVELVTELADLGVRVIVAGLDLDFPAASLRADPGTHGDRGVRRQDARGLRAVRRRSPVLAADRGRRAAGPGRGYGGLRGALPAVLQLVGRGRGGSRQLEEGQ